MANSITNAASSTGEASTLTQAYVGEGAFSKLFSTVYCYEGTISDQDAVAISTIEEYSITVTGVALGDIVIGVSVNAALNDAGGDEALCEAHVSAANTVLLRLHADTAEFAADTLNNKVVKMLIGRPAW